MKKSLKYIFPPALLLAVNLTAALPTLRYGYLLEDYMWLRSYDTGEVVRTFFGHWEPTLVETRGYRPLHSVHYAFFHLLLGGDPFRNHLLQIALMAAAAATIYFLVLRAMGRVNTALWAGLIYSLLSTTAWQVTRLTDRGHILLVIFLGLALISYDIFLSGRSRRPLAAAWIFCLAAILLKEDAVTFPLLLPAWALVIRGENPWRLRRSLAPFFILLAGFLLVRAVIVSRAPDDIMHPPPLPATVGGMAREYSRGLLAGVFQTQGIRDPAHDFPLEDSGLVTPRDWWGFFAGGMFLIIGGGLVFFSRSEREKRLILFALILILIANVMVAAWYRTNRLFILSIGSAIIFATALTAVIRTLAEGRSRIIRAAAGLGLAGFAGLLTVNLLTYFEIQRAFHPESGLVRTWDTWVYQEYLPWMKEEQILIFRDQLLRTGRDEWAQSLDR